MGFMFMGWWVDLYKEIIMKKCFFALILISTSLGQDILITQAGTKYDGKMLEVRQDKIEFQA